MDDDFTGHRSDAAVVRYVSRISEKRKQLISDSLTVALNGDLLPEGASSSKRAAIVEPSTVATAPINMDKPTAVLEKDGIRLSFFI